MTFRLPRSRTNSLLGQRRRRPTLQPLQVVSATQSAIFGWFARWLEPLGNEVKAGLESHRSTWRIKQSENGQLRRNRQKLRDEPRARKV